MNDDSLYNNLSATAASSNNLLVDLKENPKRYVHFSLISFGGGKSKTKKETTKKPNGEIETETKTKRDQSTSQTLVPVDTVKKD